MDSAPLTFFARGKLLLTSEYVVLDGVPAWAVPTRLGQHLQVTPNEHSETLFWDALDVAGNAWMSGSLERSASGWKPMDASVDPFADSSVIDSWMALANLLNAAENRRGKPLPGGRARTVLEFPRDYGWGSSSTLISLVAQWAEVPALDLHFDTQNGSGYDAVCAQANGPIRYTKTGARSAIWESASLDHWPHSNLYLVHLGHKQRSAADVVRYRTLRPSADDLQSVARAAALLVAASDLNRWENAVREHEEHMARILNRPTAASLHFSGFPGAVKSLGAWGGDFVLVSVRESEVLNQLNSKGFTTVLPWNECVVLS